VGISAIVVLLFIGALTYYCVTKNRGKKGFDSKSDKNAKSK